MNRNKVFCLALTLLLVGIGGLYYYYALRSVKKLANDLDIRYESIKFSSLSLGGMVLNGDNAYGLIVFNFHHSNGSSYMDHYLYFALWPWESGEYGVRGGSIR